MGILTEREVPGLGSFTNRVDVDYDEPGGTLLGNGQVSRSGETSSFVGGEAVAPTVGQEGTSPSGAVGDKQDTWVDNGQRVVKVDKLKDGAFGQMLRRIRIL